MTDIEGAWDCVVQTPMGAQNGVLTVKRQGDGWVGSLVGDLGSKDVTDGRIEGDTLIWSMAISRPMPLTVACTARVEGDRINGGATIGGFGTFPLTGQRKG